MPRYLRASNGQFWDKNPPAINFRNYRQSGVSHQGRISLSHTPSIYLVLHELTHEVHGYIQPLIGKKDNKGIPNHHGPDYLAHLIFLKDMVLKRKVYKKWFEAAIEPILINPAIKKSSPLVAKQDDGTYSIRLAPTVQNELQVYCLDCDEEEQFRWLENALRTGARLS